VVEFSDLGGVSPSDFQSTLTFTVTEVDPENFTRFGMLVLADSASASNLEDTGIYAELIFLSNGDIDLGLRTGITGTRFADATWSGDTRATIQGRTITMNLSGTYSGGDLLLDLTASDDNSYSLSLPTETVAASSYSGSYFGMGARLAGDGNGTSNMIIDNQSFAVIPEPGTLALVGIALGSLLLFRRKS
jgi:hypothetical protein